MLLDPQMHELEERIMSDIIRRIRINGEITSSADWQIHRLYELGMSKREIRKIIKETLDLSPAEISHMYKQVLRSGYARSRELYKAKGAPWIPFDKNTGLQQLINAVSVQTAGTLQNITQSLGFATRVGGKLAYLPIADYYQKTLDAAMYDIASGAFDYNTVLKRTVREMTGSGLRTIDYASGWANRVEVAARRAIMTGMGQLTGKINEDNAKALETDWFEITWHSGFRPEHDWGGKWFRRPDLVRVCGLGSVTGLCGANCYHDYYPVIPGISVPLYTDEQLKAMNEAEQKPVEWKGKTYTKYEATQRQRALETTMRAQRQEMKLLQEGGADEDDLINLRARYRATSQEYVRFSEAAGLPQQRERVSIDGLGNIMQGKYTGGSGKESPVRVPPVGAKRGTPVQDAERSELLEHPRMVLTSGAQSGIIKSIDIDDYSTVTYGKNILPEVNDVILNTMKQCEKDGGFIISEISTTVSPSDAHGTPILQIEPLPNGLLQLNVNASYLSGKTLKEIDADFLGTEKTVVNSLKEAVIHESGHAISIKGKTTQDIRILYQKLKNAGLPGVSDIALADGAECLAELEVLRSRGEKVSKELADFYKKYMGRDY